jgi:methylglyoxal synthase
MSVIAPLGGVVDPTTAARKRIVLISHHNREADLLDWARYHRDSLARHELVAYPDICALLSRELGLHSVPDRLRSLDRDPHVHPDATMRAGRVDFVVLFWDPLEPLPRDTDVTALLRLALEHDIPIASTRAAADFAVTASLHEEPYSPRLSPLTHGAPGLRRRRPSPCP